MDQYQHQGMFLDSISPPPNAAIFNFVWTYCVKTDGTSRKKARCTWDGSPRSGQAHTLDHTYASCVEQTGARIFYALAAQENLLIYSVDASKAFPKAHAP